MLVTLPFVTDGNPHCPCACEITLCNSCVVLVYVVATYRLEEAVGVADHQVIDSGSLTASSYLKNDEKAPWKVLDQGKEWCAANWDTQPWIHIDLSSENLTIEKIKIKRNRNSYVTVTHAFVTMTFANDEQRNFTVIIMYKIARLNVCPIQFPCFVRISTTKIQHIHVLVRNLTSFQNDWKNRILPDLLLPTEALVQCQNIVFV